MRLRDIPDECFVEFSRNLPQHQLCLDTAFTDLEWRFDSEGGCFQPIQVDREQTADGLMLQSDLQLSSLDVDGINEA